MWSSRDSKYSPINSPHSLAGWDEFKVPEREKQEVLAAFANEKGKLTAGCQPWAVNWRGRR
jgi:hypothetical protein